MSTITPINFYGNSQQSENKQPSALKTGAVVGTVVTGCDFAANMIFRKNTGDTFTSIARNAAKTQAGDTKELLSGFCNKILRSEKAANFVEKCGNKKMLAAALAGNILFFSALAACWNAWNKNS